GAGLDCRRGDSRHHRRLSEGRSARRLARNEQFAAERDGKIGCRPVNHDAPAFEENAQSTMAPINIVRPQAMVRTALRGAARHSRRTKPIRFAVSNPIARLSGQPMEGPRSPSRGVAAPYRKM